MRPVSPNAQHASGRARTAGRTAARALDDAIRRSVSPAPWRGPKTLQTRREWQEDSDGSTGDEKVTRTAQANLAAQITARPAELDDSEHCCHTTKMDLEDAPWLAGEQEGCQSWHLPAQRRGLSATRPSFIPSTTDAVAAAALKHCE